MLLNECTYVFYSIELILQSVLNSHHRFARSAAEILNSAGLIDTLNTIIRHFTLLSHYIDSIPVHGTYQLFGLS